MASWHSSFVSASKVGSQFVQQYYDVLQHQPEFTHRFYNGSSTMIRVDGDSTQTASAVSGDENPKIRYQSSKIPNIRY
ncbi:putative Ras GTPase-activating protein-binding protein [Helianthus annuus]|nr:putative Ras GTPase-activating protein-binding protein [Helianthus annuus]